MKTIKYCQVALIACSLSLLVANKSNGQVLFPTEKKPITTPTKITSSKSVNDFVSNSFSFYSQTNSARTQLSVIFNQLNAPGADYASLLQQTNNVSTTLLKVLPMAKQLTVSAPDLYQKAKSELKVWDYLRALVNIKSAMQAMNAAVGDLKFMMKNTIPQTKQLLKSKSTGALMPADSSVMTHQDSLLVSGLDSIKVSD